MSTIPESTVPRPRMSNLPFHQIELLDEAYENLVTSCVILIHIYGNYMDISIFGVFIDMLNGGKSAGRMPKLA